MGAVKLVELEDEFKDMLRSGEILDKLKSDFGSCQVLGKEEYLGFFEYAYKEYPNMTFFIGGGIRLDIGYGGYLSPSCLSNNVIGSDMGDDFVFIVTDVKNRLFNYVSNYDKLRDLLKGACRKVEEGKIL